MVQLSELNNITVSDVTGQKNFRLQKVSRSLSVGEMLQPILPRFHRVDANENPVGFAVHLAREGRLVSTSELVGDLEENDHLILQPRILAGGPPAPALPAAARVPCITARLGRPC